MKITKRSRCWLVGTLLVNAACWPFQAGADEIARLTANDTPELFGNAAVNAENLAVSRGGTEFILNDIKSDGIVRDNQAYNLTTGSNWITEGSFAGSSGFSTVIQNSGNNVLIQNPTIINLQVQ